VGSPGHVLVAPDKFKGSLTAGEVAAHLAAGLQEAGLTAVQLPVADGGEGTLDAALTAGFRRVPVTVTGPTGDPVCSAIAVRHGVGVVELAAASGLALLAGARPAPLTATSRGTGELLRAALDNGCTRIVLGVGGSAGTDGGAGMLAALGARLLDAGGAALPDGGAALAALHRLDLSHLDPRLAGVDVVLAGDVDNPLLGRDGAAAGYGPQKGASPADVAVLETALTRWADLLEARAPSWSRHDAGPGAPRLPASTRTRPGAGAAGGVGFAALTVLGATPRPGIDVVLDLVGFADRLPGAALVVTGEGSLDEQSLRGKAPIGVAAAARAAGVPVVAVCGRCRVDPDRLAAAGIVAAHTLTDLEPDLGRCLEHAGPLLRTVARQVAEEQLRRTLGGVRSVRCITGSPGPGTSAARSTGVG
jgi:glycerate kinase